jgi:hypothetical protein
VICPFCKKALEALGSRANVLRENLEDRHQIQVMQRARCSSCSLLFQWEQPMSVSRIPVSYGAPVRVGGAGSAAVKQDTVTEDKR